LRQIVIDFDVVRKAAETLQNNLQRTQTRCSYPSYEIMLHFFLFLGYGVADPEVLPLQQLRTKMTESINGGMIFVKENP
jgi:hypothetical protein